MLDGSLVEWLVLSKFADAGGVSRGPERDAGELGSWLSARLVPRRRPR
ncbi:MAG: hypothetical protein HZY75_10675 [Nocardioidaceae bacterium]|nr:MAG: hypothetical protein HZY75_10675 [Nocardioidaceae bacterium]